jgi:hypothetical protein
MDGRETFQQRLFGCPPGARVYAVLDPAYAGFIYDHLPNGSSDSCCLWRETTEPPSEPAPYLVRLHPGSPLVGALEKTGKQTWGVFLWSCAEIGALRKHLRRMMMPRFENGSMGYVRFFGCGMFPIMLTAEDVGALPTVFGPVDAFLFGGKQWWCREGTEPDDRLIIRRRPPPDGRISSQKGPIRLGGGYSDLFSKDLRCCCVPLIDELNTIEDLLDQRPELVLSYAGGKIREMVRDVYEEAYEINLYCYYSSYSLCEESLRLGVNVLQQGFFGSVLEDTLMEPRSKARHVFWMCQEARALGGFAKEAPLSERLDALSAKKPVFPFADYATDRLSGLQCERAWVEYFRTLAGMVGDVSEWGPFIPLDMSGNPFFTAKCEAKNKAFRVILHGDDTSAGCPLEAPPLDLDTEDDDLSPRELNESLFETCPGCTVGDPGHSAHVFWHEDIFDHPYEDYRYDGFTIVVCMTEPGIRLAAMMTALFLYMDYPSFQKVMDRLGKANDDLVQEKGSRAVHVPEDFSALLQEAAPDVSMDQWREWVSAAYTAML